MNKHVLILGAGFGGLELATRLSETLEDTVRVSVLKTRASYLQAREHKLTELQQNMDLGTYGGEVVRYLIEQIHSELVWMRRLRRVATNTKSNHRKSGREL